MSDMDFGEFVSKERREELEEASKLRTQDDEMLLHVFSVHIAAFLHEAGMAASELVLSSDDRAISLLELLIEFRDKLLVFSDSVMESIPGTITRDEAKSIIDKARMKDLLERAIKPGDPMSKIPFKDEDPKDEDPD